MRYPRISTALLFGRCIAAVREDLGLTQAQLAERLELSRPALAQMESGRSAPSFWVMMRIGEHLGEGFAGRDSTAIMALLRASARELRDQGVRIVNRIVDPDELTVPVAQIDRAVARVYDREFARFVPVEVIYLDDGEE